MAFAHAQDEPAPVDPVPTAFTREWLVEAEATAPIYGPIVDQEYRNLGFPWWSARVGHRITRELWFLGAIDHYREIRESNSNGRCPDGSFPCPETFVDDFHFNAYTINLRLTFARSPNADAFATLGTGVADIWRYSAHLVKLIVPAEVGIKGWVVRGLQLQWGPTVTLRTIFGMDEQWRVSNGDMITDPVLVGVSVGMFARW
jgi:hypothetical protein